MDDNLYEKLKEKGISISSIYVKYCETFGDEITLRTFYRYIKNETKGAENSKERILAFIRDSGYLKLINNNL